MQEKVISAGAYGSNFVSAVEPFPCHICCGVTLFSMLTITVRCGPEIFSLQLLVRELVYKVAAFRNSYTGDLKCFRYIATHREPIFQYGHCTSFLEGTRFTYFRI